VWEVYDKSQFILEPNLSRIKKNFSFWRWVFQKFLYLQMFAKFKYYGIWLCFAAFDCLYPTEISKLVPFMSVLLPCYEAVCIWMILVLRKIICCLICSGIVHSVFLYFSSMQINFFIPSCVISTFCCLLSMCTEENITHFCIWC
jgi:hypothetical protein